MKSCSNPLLMINRVVASCAFSCAHCIKRAVQYRQQKAGSAEWEFQHAVRFDLLETRCVLGFGRSSWPAGA